MVSELTKIFFFVWMGKEKDKPKVTLFGHLVQKIKILGVYFALDVRIKEDMNYKEILSKIKTSGVVETKRFDYYGQSPFKENIRSIKIELYFISYSSSKVGNVRSRKKLLLSIYGMGSIELNVM